MFIFAVGVVFLLTPFAATPLPRKPPLRAGCRSCTDRCQVYDIDRDGGLCKCDADCEVYGDCCGPSASRKPDACQGVPTNAILADGLRFTCQSVFLNSAINVMKHEAFWMVSRCSADWLDEVGESGQMVLDGCVSSSRDLPPVTDRVTGVVYKNQHCALCNHVESAVPWEASVVCTQYFYNLLETTSFSEISLELFQEQCQPCSYQPLSHSVQYLRACYPLNTDACLFYADDTFQSCVNGTYDIHVGEDRRYVERTYRNRGCAQCNGAYNTRCLYSEASRGSHQVPTECVPKVAPPTIEPPPKTKPPPSTSSPPTTTPASTSTAPPTTTSALTTGSGSIATTNRPNKPKPPTPRPPPPRSTLAPTTSGPSKTEAPTAPDPSVEPAATEGLPDPPNQGIPFTITLSNLGDGFVSVATETETLNVTVDCPEGQAPVGLECRDTICPQGFVSVDGRCFSQQNPRVSDDRNQSANASGGFFLDCPTELVPLNDTEFTQLSNNTVQLVDGEVKDILGYSKDGQPLICPDNVTTIEVNSTLFSYPAGFLELTYIGCSLSVIGSSLVLITYGLFDELRTLPSKIVMNLAFANLVTNLLILIGGPVSQAFPIIQLCTAVAICLHFFFLAQFAWMSVMSFEVVRKFRRAKDMLVDSKQDKLRFLMIYLLFGWGLPLLITVATIVVNFTKSEFVLYGVLADGSLGSCWINHLESVIIAFLVPIILSVSFNLVVFIAVIVYICMASRSQAKMKRKFDKTPFVHLCVAVFCTTGLTWTFGFVAIIAKTKWAWYLFIIFNSTQGFVIFIAFICTKKTLKLYISLLTGKRSGKATKSSLLFANPTSTFVMRDGQVTIVKQNSIENITAV